MRCLSCLKLESVLLMAVMVSTSWGRLGESPEKCDQRYGMDFVQKGPEGFWAFTREYTKNDIKVTIRFIDLVGRGKVAGWIAYTPAYTLKDAGGLREKIRETVSGSWEVIEEVKITHDMPPETVERTKVRNKRAAETRDAITRVSGWTYGSFWTSPAAYAADNGSTLIMFSNSYFGQFEYWQASEEKRRENQKNASLPAGF